MLWVKSEQASTHKAGHVQWYLADKRLDSPNRFVGEVVCLNAELGTYYAELRNGRGLRYFTDVDVAKDWLWSFYCLERAS